MKVLSNSKTHLTYCLNVHPGESWDDNLEVIRTHAAAVKREVCPDAPFGLGLRISNEASLVLAAPERIEEFRRVLADEGMYAFTINGFPYGAFHNTQVKEMVYQPDWRMAERVEYTKRLAGILAAVLPDGVNGSISTVPGSYGAWIESDADRGLMAANLSDTAEYLARLREETGKLVHIGLEPEPDCFLEKTADVIEFFDKYLLNLPKADVIREHIGVCFDTCHLAIQFEDLSQSLEKLKAAGILISKIQVSSALKTVCDDDIVSRLEPFCDPVYLHQVKVREPSGEIVSVSDLPEALERWAEFDGEWRVHFHVPLYFSELEGMQSTSDQLTAEFFMLAAKHDVEHIEMETYTFDVLPAELKERGVESSIVSEYEWIKEQLVGALL